MKIRKKHKSLKLTLEYHTMTWNEIIRLIENESYKNYDEEEILFELKMDAISNLFVRHNCFTEMYNECFLCDWFVNECNECSMKHKCIENRYPENVEYRECRECNNKCKSWETCTSAWHKLCSEFTSNNPDKNKCIELAERIRDLIN